MPPGVEPELSEFPHRLTIPTRWGDNDIYGHVNNVQYYAFFDTIINDWLIKAGGLDIHAGEAIGLCAESHCQFLAPISFPDVVVAGLRVGILGNSSVRYEIGLFTEDEAPLADGYFVHVFVDRLERKPVEIPVGIREAMETIKAADA
jgi:acyl-CoA thioester hydrolase